MKRPVIVGLVIWGAVCVGCSDDDAMLDDTDGSTGTDTTSSTSTSTSTTGTTTTSSTTMDPSAAETGYDPPQAECGNGFVEGDEECDDGNVDDGDLCSSDCEIQCGLQWEAAELPPTALSVLDPVGILATADRVVVSAARQENTANQKGEITYGPFEGAVNAYDLEGGTQWSVTETADFDDFRLAGIVADDAGDIYVAATADAMAGGTDIWVGKFSASDGSSLWPEVVIDGGLDDSEDSAADIAIAPDGGVVVSGLIRAGAGDDDVWVGKFAAADGAEVWTSTWSGAGSGNFSNDEPGPVVVASDGTVLVLSLEYLSFDAEAPNLLSFPAAGGAATVTPLSDLPAGQQAYTLLDARIDGSDNLFLLYAQDGAASRTYFVEKLGSDLSQTWRLTQDDFQRMGSGWDVLGIDVSSAGELVVVGDLVNDYETPPEEWSQIWVSRMDSDGQEQCFVQQTSTLEGLAPADLFSPDVALGPDGSVFVAGNQSQMGDDTLWVGSFRAP